MRSLEDLIRLAKEDNENAMLEIIEKFQPLINKYYKNSYYNEDIKSALELKLTELVKIELNIKNIRSWNEGTLVNYIASSLYHQYLAISNKINIKSKSELIGEDEILINPSDLSNYSPEKIMDDILLFESLQAILTEREFYCIYNHRLYGIYSRGIIKKIKYYETSLQSMQKTGIQKNKKIL